MNYAHSQKEVLEQRDQLLKQRQQIAEEKERLDRVNGEIERQLVGLDYMLDGLEFLSTDRPPELEAPGFTEQVRRVLQQTLEPLTAIEVRDSLLAAGVKHTSPRNLLISVHTVFGRIKSDLRESDKAGKPAYKWKRRFRVARKRRLRFPRERNDANGGTPHAENK
jgi:hypothetical protein